MGHRSSPVSERKLHRITDLGSRQPLDADALQNFGDESGDKPLLNPVVRRASLRDTAKAKAPNKRPPGLEKTKLQYDQETIKVIFEEIEREVRAREARTRKSSERFRLNFAEVPPTEHSILDDPKFKNSAFFGFYIYFWLGTGFLILKDLLNAYINNRTPLWKSPVFQIFSLHLLQIAFLDLAMYASIYVVFFIQLLCKKGMRWRRAGRALTLVYEVLFTGFWLYTASNVVARDQWIGRVFLVLHMFVLLMKMHSYAFYNGYLWKILAELKFSELYLQKLYDPDVELPKGFELELLRDLIMELIAFCKFELLHQSRTLEKAKKDDALSWSSDELCAELVKFPRSITLADFFAYTMYPTVLYSIAVPRTSQIRWRFLGEKLIALFGVILLMIMIADHSIYPVVMRCNEFRETLPLFKDRCFFATMALIDIIPPLSMEYLFVFYLIWDVILNGIAEVSMFADRDFYGPWWSCVDWFEYARLWNKPVHVFLLRHVYHSSISTLSLSKPAAMGVTFVLSSIVHEIIMYVIFERFRGFLFFFQMFQIPLVLISRTKYMKDKRVLGNVVCWFGFVIGPPIICILYLTF